MEPVRINRFDSGMKKVVQNGGTYVTAIFYNPLTMEYCEKCVRDYDYSDGSRDNDELYHMPIDEAAHRDWCHAWGAILVGDTVVVVRGRKVPHGTVGKVVSIKDWKDCYGRVQNTYVYFEDGTRTSIWNCELK